MMLRTSTMLCAQQPSTSQGTIKQMPSPAVRQVVALAVISRLHDWCVQLFWITILCVISCVGDEKQKTSASQLNQERTRQRKNLESTRSPRSRNIAEIEMKLLRHLTSPQFAACRPVQRHSKKRHAVLSRPPSPQLFDIREEEPEDL